MNKDIKPQLWVIAGPNGAGKSTFVAKQSLAGQIPIVNPDEIAKRIDPNHRGETAVIAQAGREALLERRALMAQGKSFGIETTLTGRGEVQLMQQAREQGYKVNLVYVGISDAKQSNTRVAFRVSQGGHDVPESDIMRRFERSMNNLSEAIKAADRSFVLDNSARQYRLLFSIEKENLRFVSKELPAWSKEALGKAGLSLEGRASEKVDATVLQRAQAFDQLKQQEALARYPELDGAYKQLQGVRAEGAAEGLGMQAREARYQEARAQLSEQLHRGQVPQGPVTLAESRQVLEMASSQRGLMMRDGDGFGRDVKGEVVAESSHHVLVKISDMMALGYEKEKLERSVQVGERVSIEHGRDQHRVHEQGREPAKEAGRDLGREMDRGPER